jgi:hypothetical protein
VKIHGTHAAVECSGCGIRPMSRERYISILSDNAGFAVFCSGHMQATAIRAIERQLRVDSGSSDDDIITIYGEWCGPGIQKGVAVNQLSERHFVVFAASRAPVQGEHEYIDVVGPFKNRFSGASIYSIYDSPTWSVDVDFNDELACERTLNNVEELTLAVEAQCPYAVGFSITGVGEGIVWTPIDEHFGRPELFWKSKGPKHREVKSKASQPSLQPEQLESVEAFVEYALTEARLEKGLDHVRAMGCQVDMTSTGLFLRWVADDIVRECADELAANSLEWKFIARYVNTRALNFWKKTVTRDM